MLFPCGHDKPNTCERCDLQLIRRRGFLRGLVGAAALVAAPKPMIQVPRSYQSGQMRSTVTINGQTWTCQKATEGDLYTAFVQFDYAMAT